MAYQSPYYLKYFKASQTTQQDRKKKQIIANNKIHAKYLYGGEAWT